MVSSRWGVRRAREGRSAVRRDPQGAQPIRRESGDRHSIFSPALHPMHHDGRLSDCGVRRRIMPLKKQRLHASQPSNNLMPLCPAFPLFLSACHVCPIVAVIGIVPVRRMCIGASRAVSARQWALGCQALPIRLACEWTCCRSCCLRWGCVSGFPSRKGRKQANTCEQSRRDPLRGSD